MAERTLVTGGAGFIGSNFIRYYLKEHSDSSLVNFDKLTYAGNLENLADVDADPRYRFVEGDIADRDAVEAIFEGGDFDFVVNFAAESHVDRSILDAGPFIEANVRGVQVLLDVMCRRWRGAWDRHRFLQVSTDEVYGELGEAGRFVETMPLAPRSPYSASKAAADLLCLAYYQTFEVPVLVTRSSNNYGPFQFPEKLIPLIIWKAVHDERLPIYGDGRNVRDWIHVLDHCRAIDAILHVADVGQVYNIGGNSEQQNIDVVRMILRVLGKPDSLIQFVADRPGHDRRYAIDASKTCRRTGWKPQMAFEEGLEQTVSWYAAHLDWCERCMTGEYRKYYDANYQWRNGTAQILHRSTTPVLLPADRVPGASL